MPKKMTKEERKLMTHKKAALIAMLLNQPNHSKQIAALQQDNKDLEYKVEDLEETIDDLEESKAMAQNLLREQTDWDESFRVRDEELLIFKQEIEVLKSKMQLSRRIIRI